MKYLLFDTETSGLIDASTTEETIPHLLQLGALLTCGDLAEDIEIKQDNYLNWGDEVVYDKKAVAIHGITKSIIDSNGIDPLQAMKTFDALVRKANVICAFNLEFDQAIIKAAYKRVGGTGQAYLRKKKVCLMQSSRSHCKLPKPSGITPEQDKRWPENSLFRFKNPSLEEAYILLDPDGGDLTQGEKHDAFKDTFMAYKVLLGLLEIDAKLFFVPRSIDRRPKSPENQFRLNKVHDILAAIEEETGESSLSNWEQDFMAEWQMNVEQYGDSTFPPTDKQWSCIVKIAAKLGL